MVANAVPTEWLFFAYREYGDGFQIRALGRSDREPDFSGTIPATGQRVQWSYPLEFLSRGETESEQRERWARTMALGFQSCRFNDSIAADEFLISTTNERSLQFRRVVHGVFRSSSIAQLAPFQLTLVLERIDREHRKFIADLRSDTPFEELITCQQQIDFAASLKIRAGEYLTITVGQNGPPACLAIRKMKADGQFEGEIFTTVEVPAGVIDIYSDESRKINGIPTRIESRIGHMELAN